MVLRWRFNKTMLKIVMGFRRMRFVVHVVLREILGGEMEKLTGGLGKL